MKHQISPVSPVTGSTNVRVIRRFSADFCIQKYQKSLQVDVSNYFKDIDHISLCLCLDTGYQFFTPFELAGKSDLYEKLEHFDWYYESDKWEFEEALKFLQPGDRVLEVGSGRGDFLCYLQSHQIEGSGLELNPSAIEVCRSKGVNVISESIEDFTTHHPEQYDAIVSFHVLEHLTDIKAFFQNCLGLLKQGGRLILAVPNNDSYIRYQIPSTNLPPHHMGWWNKDSLASLPNYFPMTLQSIDYETLTDGTANGYIWTIEDRFLPKFKLARSFLYRFVHPFFANYVRDNLDQIIGHTILSIYTKY